MGLGLPGGVPRQRHCHADTYPEALRRCVPQTILLLDDLIVLRERGLKSGQVFDFARLVVEKVRSKSPTGGACLKPESWLLRFVQDAGSHFEGTQSKKSDLDVRQ